MTYKDTRKIYLHHDWNRKNKGVRTHKSVVFIVVPGFFFAFKNSIFNNALIANIGLGNGKWMLPTSK